jgi:predicted PurR-regulated permease PerM
MMLHITPRTWLALLALGPAGYIAIQALPLLRSLFLLLLIISFLALLIAPMADRFEQRGVPRKATVTVTLLGSLGLLAALVLMILPVIFESLQLLASALRVLAEQIPSELVSIEGLSEIGEAGQSLVGQMATGLGWAAGQAGTLLSQVGAISFAAFVVFVCVFALVGNRATAPGLMRLLLPVRYHARALELTRAVGDGLARWFLAQIAICGYYTLSYGVTNLLLGVPYGVPIAIIAGLLEFIPYLGGIVGLVLSVAAAATVSPTTALIVAVVNVIIGAGCVYVVAPYAFSKAVEVPAALILLGLFVGGLVGGFFAALLTIPLITAILVVLRELRPDLRPAHAEAEPEPTAAPATPATKHGEG